MEGKKKTSDTDTQTDVPVDETEDPNEKIIKGYASEREAHEVASDKKNL
jgi:hypothetical protein